MIKQSNQPKGNPPKEGLSTTYDPKNFEENHMSRWLEKGYFTPTTDPTKEPYTIIMPPPNITGKLHMGHALDNTLQDILIRFRRMQGRNALWLPGQDHASIATEVKVENELLARGIVKKEIGREKFLEYTWEWANEYRGKIKEQLDRMGCSVDYTREAFTMDENVSLAVRKTFVNLYNEGLIYQGQRITNWCPKCLTAISDAEINYEEQEGHFWHIQYPLTSGEGFVEIATTRPETLLGDTAVAVHPEDARYRHLVGQSVRLPLTDRIIPIIADEYVDMEFGTGVVKITPAHDPNDYQVGLRHHLKEITIMDDHGVLNENGYAYQGMERTAARKAMVKDLKEQGFLLKVQDIRHNVSTHDRCGTAIEPMITNQWYVKMAPLAAPAVAAVRNKEITFIPERMEKTYYNWMENIQDWCISRQLWWGHQIPVWTCASCGEKIVAMDTPQKCPVCSHEHLIQDEDVLDTWFSSALWPFSTLGWPQKTEDLAYFYPTSTLVTGYDIIFFWVARMIFSGLHTMGQKPFDTVLFHGIVRDDEGRKMSKSLGNGVDPLDVIDQYGADALRYMLATGNAPGSDIRYNQDKVESARNFANKIWNASRFAMMNLDAQLMERTKESAAYSLADQWILSRSAKVVQDVTENLDRFEIGIALQKIYDFLWTEFCDWYIELSKTAFQGSDEEAKGVAMNVLVRVLSDGLKLLHPVMPFITEEIYTHLTGEETIVRAAWPSGEASESLQEGEREMELVIGAIKAIRAVRQEMNVHPARKAKTYVLPEAFARSAFLKSEAYLKKLGFAQEVIVLEEKPQRQDLVAVVTPGAEIFLPLLDLIDLEQELHRLSRDIKKYEGEVARIEKKLSNERFLAKAPQELVEAEREKMAGYQALLDKSKESYEAAARMKNQ
ncbi:Valyl-tRNA synthetase [Clostridiaceae bacterium JG1575]|nr:Valyl-tRNA synthetase [Clostridiaceae bacterium JG1575]